ncbi:MAG: NADPH:quinone reductase [Burkholderiaceae bacterium]
MPSMHGYRFTRAGAANEVLEFGQYPIPQPAAGEVQVRLAVSAVNPTDTKRRTDGRELPRFGQITPNNDGSGWIAAVGEGVSTSRIGERVWLFAAQAGRPDGTGAQFCTVPAAYAVPLPDNTSLAIGACLGVPAVTAHRAVFADGPVNGQTVLVTGGTGRVGRYAVQIALQAGARVIASCRTDQDAQDLSTLGVKDIIMRNETDIASRTLEMTNDIGVDRFIDVAFGANVQDAPRIIKPNGVLISYGSDYNPEPVFPFIQFMYRNITLRPFSIMGMPEAAKLQAFHDITNYLQLDIVSHAISVRLPFNDMVKAHELIEKGDLRGCVLVDIADEA